MQNPKSNDSRRKLLKIIAAGGGAVVAGKSLPENWARPVVDAVVLPVHAQTSPPPILLCNIPAGCYPAGNQSISFSGGVEGDLILSVPVYSNNSCSGGTAPSNPSVAVARTQQDAAAILGIAVVFAVAFVLDNPPAGGCSLWFDNN